MNHNAYRRRRLGSFRLIACVHHRREAAGDGRARTAILVAQAIAGCVSGGMGTGRKWMWPPSEWTVGLWRQCCHVGGVGHGYGGSGRSRKLAVRRGNRYAPAGLDVTT